MQGGVGEKIEATDITYVLKMRITSFFAHKMGYEHSMRIILSLT